MCLRRLSLCVWAIINASAPDRERDIVSSFQLPASSYQLPATSFQLPATSYQLPATNSDLQAARPPRPEARASSWQLETGSLELGHLTPRSVSAIRPDRG